jgi:Fe-S-cluster-containing dehydrogenase component
MSKQKAFYFDASACVGCKVCQVACQDKHDNPPEILWRRVFEYGGGSWLTEGNIFLPNNVFKYFVSTASWIAKSALAAAIVSGHARTAPRSITKPPTP